MADDARRLELLELLARAALDDAVVEDAVAWALALVLADDDEEALQVIAGMNGNTPRDEVEPWLRRAAAAWGVRVPVREESGRLLYIQMMRESAVLAREMTDGRAPVVDGCQHLYGVWRTMSFGQAVSHDLANLFRPVINLAYDLDRYPPRQDRVHWDPQALRALDEDSRALGEQIRPRVVLFCSELVAGLDREIARVAEAFFTSP